MSSNQGKNKTNLMTEQDKTRHQLEELHKDHDLTKQELENLKKQIETLKTRHDGDSKQMLKKIEKREHELETYKKQTEEKEVLTKKRIDELETCIKTLTLTDEDTRQQQQQLFDACLHGTLDDIKNMVNIDVNVRDSVDQTPLFKCCQSSVSPVDKIQYLFSHQADINARDSDNHTILHWACYSGTLSTVQYLVDDLHMNVATTAWLYHTPLFMCCGSSISPVDKIKYLVSHRADIKAIDWNNNTILHWACLVGTVSTVQYFVDDLHMDVNAEDGVNRTPLFACCASSVTPVDKIKYLVSHQADINTTDYTDNTILHTACFYGTLSTVRYLVDDLHMDVNAADWLDQTPLVKCCRSSVSSVDKMQYLVSRQADINVRDRSNFTILHWACGDGTLATVKYLVDDLRMNVNARCDTDRTPLFDCCSSSVSPVDKINYLVSHQADINTKNKWNDTILHWACEYGVLSTVQYLVDDMHMDVQAEGQYIRTPLFNCCESYNSPLDKIQYLVSHQADSNAADCNNDTILHVACMRCTLFTVEYLVDDLHMDVNTTGRFNWTPLFYCCRSDASPVDKMQFLVSHQADINARTIDDKTILHQACYYGTLSTVEYLVDCLHLDLHVQDKDGKTPLDYCEESFIEAHEKIKYITNQMKFKIK